MHFIFKSTFLFLLLNIGFIVNGFAQKQRIIVVPYDRFQFVSQYPLEQIAIINDVELSQVFSIYKEGLIQAFASFTYDKYEFVGITSSQQLSLRKKTKYQLDKFNGKKYNATNLSLLPLEDYQTLLQGHQADYILFVNWYSIEKSTHTAYVGDNNKRYPFSLHKLDYDLYDKDKVKVLGKGNVKLNCGEFPSVELLQEKSLKVSSLKNCYKSLIEEIFNNMN